MPKTETSYKERLTHHANRTLRLTDHQSMLVLHHFVGAIQVMCEPRSAWNKGPTREALVQALERAVNSQTGT